MLLPRLFFDWSDDYGTTTHRFKMSVFSDLQLGTHIHQFREEGQIQGLAEKAYAAGTAGTRLKTDDPLDRLEMTKAPQLERFFDIHQPFAQRVFTPEASRVPIDFHQDRHQVAIAPMSS